MVARHLAGSISIGGGFAASVRRAAGSVAHANLQSSQVFDGPLSGV